MHTLHNIGEHLTPKVNLYERWLEFTKPYERGGVGEIPYDLPRYLGVYSAQSTVT